VKQQACSVVLLVLAGCAQLPAATVTQAAKAPASGEIMNFIVPADALGARDPQLGTVLAKAGTLAAQQHQPTTVLVTALAADFPYLNQAIWKGVVSQPAAKVNLENLTAGMNQSYSVSIKPAQ
jgi:hypothetical protein